MHILLQMVKHSLKWIALFLTILWMCWPAGAAGQEANTHFVQPGDTWSALAWRYNTTIAELQAKNPHPNPSRQPVVGGIVEIPSGEGGYPTGQILRSEDGGLLQIGRAHV